MSDEYMKSFFDILDGKVKFNDLDKKKRGRKPGYKHSDKTKEKIAGKMRGRVKDHETKEKISQSLSGREKPYETRQKISKSKTQSSVARDMLEQYGGLTRERDIPMTTHEFLSLCDADKLEICEWIKDNFEDINKEDEDGRSVRWEADLNADLKKEEPNLDEIGFVEKYDGS